MEVSNRNCATNFVSTCEFVFCISYGKCLTPIRAVWTPKVDKPGEYIVSFGGFDAGKVFWIP